MTGIWKLLLLLPFSLFADNSPGQQNSASPSPFVLSGFVDVQARLTDPDEDSGFVFNEAVLYLSSTMGSISLFLDLPLFQNEEDDLDFDSSQAQAYLAGDYDAGLFWQLGKFDNILGFESNDSVGATFSSGSYFAGNPFESTIMGLLVGYAFNDDLRLSFTLGNPSGENSLDGQDPEFGVLGEWENDAFRSYLGVLTHEKDSGRQTLVDGAIGKTVGRLAVDLEYVFLDPALGTSSRSLLLETIIDDPTMHWSPALRLETTRDGAGFDEADGATAGVRLRPYPNVMVKFDLTYGRTRQTAASPREDFTVLALAALYRF